VGRNIRAILHKLGDALELFEEQKIYLVTQAANDLNLTFVIDEDQGDRLVSRLHQITINDTPNGRTLGPTWEQLYGSPNNTAGRVTPWWQERRAELITLGQKHTAAYVYDQKTLKSAAQGLKAIKGLERVLFAMKANNNAEVLKLFDGEGIAFECVSPGEVERVFKIIPNIDRKRILFTPNFAPRSEYAWALEQGIWLTLDNLHPLTAWPELFRGKEVFVRIDTGYGRGHHDHVRTAGVHSKFGVPLFEMDELERAVHASGAKVVGLHAHTGSGVFNVDNWREVGETLGQLTQRFKDVRVLDLGGGLGVPEKSTEPSVDLEALGAVIAGLKDKYPSLALWIEPGRYLVAQAGVLLAQVTQLKGKGEVHYVGISTGMNSLIRPALYGAHHEIVNLSKLGEPATLIANIVGPICESADLLGADRVLPPTQEGDVLLIATAGAYGYAMSSRYNLREPAVEVVIGATHIAD
jgi:diaminopimelate decarboxylase/aspartate kinase